MFDSESGSSAPSVDTASAGREREPWERCYKALQAAGLTSGLTWPTKRFYQEMGIPLMPERDPDESDESFGRRCQLWSLTEFQPQMAKLGKKLLDDHGLWLHSLGAGGKQPARYEIRNGDAAQVCANEAVRTATKALFKGAEVLSKMDTDGLSDTERGVFHRAQARVSHIGDLIKAGKKKYKI